MVQSAAVKDGMADYVKVKIVKLHELVGSCL
jgi:hypothetical protein